MATDRAEFRGTPRAGRVRRGGRFRARCGHGEDDAGRNLFDAYHDDDVEEDGESDDASRRDDARLKPNRTHFTDAKKNKRYLFSKPGVFEYDMHKRSTNRERKEGSGGRGTTETLERFFEATGKHLADAFNDAAKEVRDGVKVKPGDANRTVKLQINTGGAFRTIRQPRRRTTE